MVYWGKAQAVRLVQTEQFPASPAQASASVGVEVLGELQEGRIKEVGIPTALREVFRMAPGRDSMAAEIARATHQKDGELFALFGPGVHANSHPQTQQTFKEL